MDEREAINIIRNYVIEVNEPGAFKLAAVDQVVANPVNTWSATKLPFAFTVLCPDVRYRPGGELYGGEIKRKE